MPASATSAERRMKGEIVVVGGGPGPVKHLTWEARDILLAERELFFRVCDHPVHAWLREQGKEVVSFDPLYHEPGISYEKVYEIIVRTLLAAARQKGRVVYVVPGHPYVFEKTPRRLLAASEGEVAVRVVPGLSFLEATYAELSLDPEEGLQIINGFNFGYYGEYPFTERLGLLIGQVGFPTTSNPAGPDSNAGAIMRALLAKFPPQHRVTLVWSTGMPEYRNQRRTLALAELADQSGFDRHLASLYVPPLRPPWEGLKKKRQVRKRKAPKREGRGE
jgi:tetrapyrrole methylase family protein/MazG family protein